MRRLTTTVFIFLAIALFSVTSFAEIQRSSELPPSDNSNEGQPY